MKQKDSLYNLFFGILSQMIILAMGLLIPRFFMVGYGSAANGLISSLHQIFMYASLLEAGVGVTALQALYAPLGRHDNHGVSSIVAAIDLYFRRTGVLYGILVLILALTYPLLAQNELPYWTIFWVTISMGAFGVVRYFFQGKYTILLQAQGKTYITSNISTIGSILANFSRIILMLYGANLIWVQSAYCVCNILPMLYIAWYIRKNCSWLDLTVPPNKEALNQKFSVLLHSISGLVFYNSAGIILTVCCNLKVVSVYAMYSLVFTMLGSVIGTVSNSITFALGQIFHTDRERYKTLQDTWENYYLAFVFSFLTVAYIHILPFMQLYTEGVNDINYILPSLALLFLISNTLDYGRKTSSQIINFAGHFKKTQWRSLAESAINLTVAIPCTIYFGIYGVLLGVIIALIYRSNDMILYANIRILERSPWPTYRRWLLNMAATSIFILVYNRVSLPINGYPSLIISATVLSIAGLVYFLAIASLFDRQARVCAYSYIKPTFQKLIKW